MRPLAQQIAIAELCRFKYIHSDGPPEHTLYGYLPGDEPDSDGRRVPDYLNDLNAMAQAEKGLSVQEQATYALFLHQNSGRAKTDHLGRDFDVLHSSPVQRAEAFLRAKGKWVDSTDPRA